MKKSFAVRAGKNFLIAGLVVLCLVQAGTLWFEGATLPELFGGIFAGTAAGVSTENALNKLTTPFRIISGTGDGRYNIALNGLNELPKRLAADLALENVLNYGEFSGAHVYAPLLGAIIIYEYAISVEAEIFDRRFNTRSGLLADRIGNVDAVYFVPNTGTLSVFFADEQAGIVAEYRLRDYYTVTMLTDSVTGASGSFHYERTGGAFIPRWHGSWHTFNIVFAGENFPAPSLVSVERQVLSFFNRPTMVISQRIEATLRDAAVSYFMYSGDSGDRVVVRYHYNTQILEYSNHSFISNETLQCFRSSFALALGVIERDATLANEVFLSGYRRNIQGFTFYFDAAVNNFPVLLSRELASSIGMEHFIEITVAKNFINYRRYAASFEFRDETEIVTVCFDMFADTFFAFTGQTVNRENEDSLKFGYMATGDRNMLLHWAIASFTKSAVE